MDDCISSSASKEEGLYFKREGAEILKSANMDSRKWHSNIFPSEENASSKVLGIP